MPRMAFERRELYAAGTERGGLLSRKYGEPMNDYIGRREKWWERLLEMDPEAGMSSVMRGELLLGNANLSATAVQMVINGTHGDYSYDAVKKVLLSNIIRGSSLKRQATEDPGVTIRPTTSTSVRGGAAEEGVAKSKEDQENMPRPIIGEGTTKATGKTRSTSATTSSAVH